MHSNTHLITLDFALPLLELLITTLCPTVGLTLAAGSAPSEGTALAGQYCRCHFADFEPRDHH